MQSANKNRILRIVAVSCIVICGIAVYYFFSPTESKFFPRCMFYSLTGWECPGCGVQRALYAMLHGEFLQAVAYNPFLCLSVPYLLMALFVNFFTGRVAERISRIVYHPYVVWGFIALFFIWWFVRNLIK